MKITKSINLIAIAASAFAFFMSQPALAAPTEGSWTKNAVATKGTWTIDDGKVTLHNLQTKNAPDLKLILSPHNVDNLQSKNAMTGAVVVSRVKNSRGTFTFELPEGIDLSLYQSIGIHCEKYTKLFAKSSL